MSKFYTSTEEGWQELENLIKLENEHDIKVVNDFLDLKMVKADYLSLFSIAHTGQPDSNTLQDVAFKCEKALALINSLYILPMVEAYPDPAKERLSRKINEFVKLYEILESDVEGTLRRREEQLLKLDNRKSVV